MARGAKWKTVLWCVGIAAVVLLLCSKSSPLFVFNDWMDANAFFTMGKSLFSGEVLYRDVFDHKGPVLHLIYGIGFLLDHTGFTGIFLLEIAALAVVLALGLRTASLLAGRSLHPAWGVVPAAGIAASRAFSHGGSAEEFMLPLLAAALYGLLKTLCKKHPLGLPSVLLQGFLAGCALWLKYTVLGFYLGWVLVLTVLYLKRRMYRELAQSCGAYLAGMALATLPWGVYFGIHDALDDWFICYFYDNLFLYSGNGGGPLALIQHLWWAARDAAPVAVLAALFLVWCLIGRRYAEAGAVLVLGAGLACTSLAGGYYQYYGLIFSVFAPLGLAPLAQIAERLQSRPLAKAAPWLGLGAAFLFCWCLSPNKNLRGRDPDTLPQLRFARTITADPQASLLNYGTLDGGFYTATGLLPRGRYFYISNMPLEEQWTEQNGLLEQGSVTYVVALVDDLAERFPHYRCIDQCSYDGGEGTVTWYLYQRQ